MIALSQDVTFGMRKWMFAKKKKISGFDVCARRRLDGICSPVIDVKKATKFVHVFNDVIVIAFSS
jgi:hypothetical protein